VPTDTAIGRTAAAEFALRGLAWSLGLFGLSRLRWTEAQVVQPLTQLQAYAAAAWFGAPSLSVEVTLACSGADALALCLGAILAYPVPWPRRLSGAAGGMAVILALNVVRIGTLGRAAASPAWFNPLHLWVWPAVLTFAITAYVFAWMRFADRRQTLVEDVGGDTGRSEARPLPTGRFIALTAAFFIVFSAAAPRYLESHRVLALAGFIARAAAAILGSVGASAYAAANVLWTPRGGFVVTEECISTPLIPVYLAAVVAYSSTWPRLTAGVLAGVPVFIGLGIVRLLVVALPAVVVASPLFLVHSFYQLLLGVVVVVAVALWRHGRRAAAPYALLGLIAGVVSIRLVGPFFERVASHPAAAPLVDPQGAIAFLPAFQVGLYFAVWVAAFTAVGWRRFLIGFAVLELTQMAGLLALHAVTTHSGFTLHVPEVRGWAVAGPLLVVAAMVNLTHARR
jgi:exosortase/archaeosortase family protein